MSKKLQGKAPRESHVQNTQIVLPSHTNALGTIFGGTVASWIDIAAAVAAGRHARRSVVTASFDAIHFFAPIRLGQIVHIHATVNYAGKTSMEVGVRVNSEDQKTGEMTHNVSSYLTFVALDENRKPTQVPPLEPETEEEKRRHEEAKLRKENRVKLSKELKREC